MYAYGFGPLVARGLTSKKFAKYAKNIDFLEMLVYTEKK